MLYALVLIFQLAFPHLGHPLNSSEATYTKLSDHPSCLLLKHRAIERDKVIRELTHLMNLGYDSPVKKIMAENNLINNKLFLDKSLWSDHSVQANFAAEISPELAAEIAKNGFEKVFISLKGPGVQWTSQAGFLPQEMSIQYDKANGLLHVSYEMYTHNYCQRGNQQPVLTWIGYEEDLDSYFQSPQVRSELLELLD